MAKLSKEELIAKINEKLSDNSELAIELMEDITDSWEIEANESEEYKAKYEELLNRYKERFLSGTEETKEEIKDEVVEEEPKEEVIDVEDIFEEEEEKKE